MKQFLPFLLTLILLSSHWFLNFARFSFEVTFLLFLELTSLYFLLKFNENLKAKIPNFLRLDVFRQKISISSFYITFSGIFAGLAFLSYTPGRIFFVLPIGFLFLSMKQWNNETIKRLLCFLIPFMIIITPLTFHLFTHTDNRVDKLFFWRNHEMTVSQKISGTVQNISTISQMFIIKGDVNGMNNYPGKPAVNPILGILFIIGLLISIKNYKNLYNKLFLFYFLISILPSLAIYPWENPSMLRTFTVIPAVVYFIGNAIIILDAVVHKIIKNKFFRYFILNTLYLILILSSFYELRTYFVYQSQIFKESFIKHNSLEKELKVDR